MEITDWYPFEIKPVYTGLYQIKRIDPFDAHESTIWAYWDGFRWGCAHPKKQKALSKEYITADTAFQNKVWRGLVRASNCEKD